MSYNLYDWNAFGQHPDKGQRIVEKINEYTSRSSDRIDLLGCQECNDGTLRRRGLETLQSAVSTAGHAIMYRPSVLTKVRTGMFDINEMDQYGRRRVAWARFRVGGEEFLHFNTHWCVCDENTLFKTAQHVASNIAEIRRQQGDSLPVILTGDFNVFGGCHNSKAIRYLTGQEVDGKRSPIVLLNEHPDNEGTHGSCKIDYILTTGWGRTSGGRDYELKEHNGSDHAMLWARLFPSADERIVTTPPAPKPAGVCTPSLWNDVDLECSGCAALVTLNGRTCDAYCADQGLGCADAWDDEEEETCSTFATRRGCQYSFVGTSDAICECVEHGNSGSPSETPSGEPSNNPEGSSGTTDDCTPSTWNDVDATCSGCAALVTLHGRTCEAYCADQGLGCSDSWDDEHEETCSPFAERRGCQYSFPGTSDAICECSTPSDGTAPQPARARAPGGSVCGIATSLNACSSTQQEVGVNMECFSYGGPNDLCSLNNNNDDNHGLDKDPSACQGEHLFLWDEPDTQGESYAWAGRTWVQYCQRWSGELNEFKGRGGRVVGPAVKNDKYVDNMNEFFAACGSACVEEGPCKIDAAAANVFTGPWNNGDFRGAARWSMDQFAKVSTQLPVLITNWSNLGGKTPDDQLPTMQVTDEFFATDAPVQIDRVYYFLARDFGGGSENNLATSVTSDGRTLGEHWRDACADLDRTVQVRPQTGRSIQARLQTGRPLIASRLHSRSQRLLKSSMEESGDDFEFSECTKSDQVFKGKPVKLVTQDPEECYAKCQANENMTLCKGWAWKASSKRPCRLYKKNKVTKAKAGFVMGKRNCHPYEGKVEKKD